MHHSSLRRLWHQGVRRPRSDSCSIDKLGDSLEPCIMSDLSGSIAKEFLRHEEHSPRCWWSSGGDLRGMAVGQLRRVLPRRVEGRSLRFLCPVLLFALRGSGSHAPARVVDDGLDSDLPTWRTKCRGNVPEGTAPVMMFERRGLKHTLNEPSSASVMRHTHIKGT